jgi:hypothetical protein
MTRAAWDSALTATRESLARMSRDQALVAVMELVALPNDGHTAIFAAFDPALKLRYYDRASSVRRRSVHPLRSSRPG